MSKVDAPEMGKAMRRLDRAETYYGIAAAALLIAGVFVSFAAQAFAPVLIGGGLVCALVSALYRLVWDKMMAQDEWDSLG